MFRNLGNWKFKDVTDEAGLAGAPAGILATAKGWIGLDDPSADNEERWKQGATFADIDNDGWLDLYVCRFGAPNLLYVNRRDGTFREEGAARGVAVSDSCGTGAFCDFDRDGWLDVFVTTNVLDAAKSPGGRPGYLFRNNGDGTFKDVTAKSGVRGDMQTHSATWWDYDNDGWPDLHVANDFEGADCLYHNNGNGTFTEVAHSVFPGMPYSSMGADTGDVDNDGQIDLFVADMAATTHEKDQRGMAYSRASGNSPVNGRGGIRQSSRNMLYLNTGAGVCREAAFLEGLAATDWTWTVRFEDLDNDGRLDLFVTNGMVREFQNADLLNRAMRAENPAERISIMRASAKLRETTMAFRNLGDYRFEEVGSPWGVSRRGVSFGAAFGDLDGDGDLDLVHSNYEENVTVLRNDSDSGHRVVVSLRGTRSNRLGVGARVKIETAAGKQLRDLVLARGYLSCSEPVLHFGLGDESVISTLTVIWPSGIRQEFSGLPADRSYLITEPASGSAIPTEPEPKAPTLFVATPPPANFVGADRHRAVADFNHDGFPDVFVGAGPGEDNNPLPGRSSLLAGRAIGTEDVTDEIAPALRDVGVVSATVWCDVDLDGWPDLLVALEWGEVKYFHNRSGRALDDESVAAGFASAGTGWWESIAAADFNGDGRPDVVAGNLGLNTQYRASPGQPAILFVGDFSDRRRSDRIEAYYESGILYPWRTRKELGVVNPGVLRRFPSNDAYARASLADIIGEERIAAARRFEATGFESGVFLSQPDGRYRFVALPRIAQIAPMRSVVAGDFDGDGNSDIYAVQNEAAPLPSVGDFIGGISQLLIGDGRGGFTPVSPAESGLIVRGMAKSVDVGEYDGDDRPDFVVTLDDGTTLAFENKTPSRTKR